MANIYDVAKRARVSAATVSAVVNDSAYVSPALKSRVEEAIGQLDYRPNSVARSLAQQRTRIIGMVALNIANPFWPAVVRGAEDAVRARGYELLLANSDDDPDKEAQDLRLFLAKRVDGILLTKACGRLPADLHAQLKASRRSGRAVDASRHRPAIGRGHGRRGRRRVRGGDAPAPPRLPRGLAC